VLLTAVGYLISIFTCDDIFPRFGSLIVCIGIYFGTSGYFIRSSGMDMMSDSYMNQELSKWLEILETKRGEVPGELLESNKQKLIEGVNKIRNNSLRDKYKLDMRILRVEGGIIMYGTLVWGFGDWFVISLVGIPCTTTY